MKIIGIASIIWIGICGLVLLILHIKSHRMIKSIFLNAIFSFIAIAVINMTHKTTGVYIPINWWTVAGSGIFGLPCVCGIILAQIIL